MTIMISLLKEKMKNEELSLRQAAEQIGVSHTTLSRMLDGKPYDLETAQKFASWLGVNLAPLLEVKYEDDSLARVISTILKMEPALAHIFKEAIHRIATGSADPSLLRELAEFAAFKLKLSEGENDNHEDGTHRPVPGN